MRKILIPIDASDCAKRAAQHAASMAIENPELQLHLLNVQEPLEPRVHAALSAQEIKSMQATDSKRVMQPVMQLLDNAGVPYRTEWRAGEVAQTIASYAEEIGCESIVMGTRGMGTIGNLIMGSVALKVTHLVTVPVTLVK
ncbi:MAG TPA: universal stress protein [Noviherbaspirillum sp.]